MTGLFSLFGHHTPKSKETRPTLSADSKRIVKQLNPEKQKSFKHKADWFVKQLHRDAGFHSDDQFPCFLSLVHYQKVKFR
jgi:hypothetical protein